MTSDLEGRFWRREESRLRRFWRRRISRGQRIRENGLSVFLRTDKAPFYDRLTRSDFGNLRGFAMDFFGLKKTRAYLIGGAAIVAFSAGTGALAQTADTGGANELETVVVSSTRLPHAG